MEAQTLRSRVSAYFRCYLVVFLLQFLWFAVVFLLSAALASGNLGAVQGFGDFNGWLIAQLILGPAFASVVLTQVRTMNWQPGSRAVLLTGVAWLVYYLPTFIFAAVFQESPFLAIAYSLFVTGYGWTTVLSTGFFILKDVAGKTALNVPTRPAQLQSLDS